MTMCDKHHIPATFFELTTALAMVKFQQTQCDVIVLEAGIGGRLDATNIFAAPDLALSVITSVQLDHQKILGSTVEQIAVEKAGIMKCRCDVFVGPDCPLGVLKVCVQK
jgi:dihydrofolate synthase/folylpolyglutamate synthase